MIKIPVELRLRYANSAHIERYPTIPDTIVATKRGVKLSGGRILRAFRSSRSPLAVIAGIESKNENLAAVSRFSFASSPPME